MTLYLPINEISVNWVAIVCLVAFLSFLTARIGISGSFLLTPLLISIGIYPSVAVATTIAYVVASLMPGAIHHRLRRNIDLRLCGLLILGGIFGVIASISIGRLLRDRGLYDLGISWFGLILLTFAGVMLLKNYFLMRRLDRPIPLRVSARTTLLERIPLRMECRTAMVRINPLIPVILGAVSGSIGSLVGVSSEYVLVPGLLYLLYVPVNIAVGTSLFTAIAIGAVTVVLQTNSGQPPDPFLLALIIAGSLIGAPLGAKFGRYGNRISPPVLAFSAMCAFLLAMGMIRVIAGIPDELYSASSAVSF